MTSFKIYIGEEIRRFRIEGLLDYDHFTEKLRQNIPSYHIEMKTLYEDDDNEKIVFSSETEFQELVSLMKKIQKVDNPLIKIWVEHSSIPYFKDGPTAEILCAYIKTKDQVIEKLESVSPSQEKIKEAIARLFPDNRILPYHIPTYLQQFLSIRTNYDAEVDVNVEVNGLAQAINEEALRLMDSNTETDLAKSKLLLESLSMIREDDPYVYYNLACAESLMKNVQSSLEQLQIACQKGYNNFQHMVEDPDLAYLRVHEQYQSFLKAVLPEKVEEKEEEKEQQVKVEVKEEIKEEPKFEEKEPQVNVEVKEETKEITKPERWADEIDVLKGMGFQLQDSVFIDVLDHHKGNLGNAVQDLI